MMAGGSASREIRAPGPRYPRMARRPLAMLTRRCGPAMTCLSLVVMAAIILTTPSATFRRARFISIADREIYSVAVAGRRGGRGWECWTYNPFDRQSRHAADPAGNN